MDKVVLLPPDASNDLVVLRVNELANGVRLNEKRLDKVEDNLLNERLQSTKELYKVSDDIKSHFDTTLKDSLKDHAIEVGTLINGVNDKIKLLENHISHVDERLNALENKEKEELYTRWQKIKAWFGKQVSDNLAKLLLALITGAILWFVGLFSIAWFTSQ